MNGAGQPRPAASKTDRPDANPVRTVDGGTRTLHIRCGSDIRGGLRRAGFGGAFLEFSDPYCLGPVRNSGSLLHQRAAFLAAATGDPEADLQDRLRKELTGLRRAGEFPRVVLWFEHDSHDQLILARILAELSELPAATELSLICIDSFPGVQRFVGLGQLDPAQLRSLWPQRVPVDADMIDLGCAVWAALQEPSPLGLHALAHGGTPELPQMAGAILRHLQELPWTGDGLSLSQRLVLEVLTDGPRSGAALFREIHNRREPMPFMGDLMFWHMLAQMSAAARPPFRQTAPAGTPWPQRSLTLTETGQALLDGRNDWLLCGPRERWVGGVEIAAADPAGGTARQWRWNPEFERPVLAAAAAPGG
ncbi:DUF1835 domain-containing protein [Marinibaculum pumilum]|uniref:DUF1835 domain-containing protein n=1 Tax=Marinibaculum pumilum TaxID=1766165 RepID=A0ABV7KUH4_9PROT